MLVVGVILVIDVGLYAQVLTPSFGMLIPGFSIFACGPNIYETGYLVFYLLYWTIVQVRKETLISEEESNVYFYLDAYNKYNSSCIDDYISY